MSNTTQRVKKLFVTNPMRMEMIRFKSRFVNCTSNPAFNKALVVLTVLSYLCILGLVFAIRRDTHPAAVLITQGVVLFLAVVMAGHGAIAGERDRRSWDLLQVAPITQAEIVVGKFLGLIALILAISLAFLPFVLISLFYYPLELSGFYPPPVVNILLAELIAITSATAAGSITLYLSARFKNSTSALTASIATFVGVLVALPLAFAALLWGSDTANQIGDVLFCWHPFWAMARLLYMKDPNNHFLPIMDRLYGVPQIALYLATSWFFVVSANALLKRRVKE